MFMGSFGIPPFNPRRYLYHAYIEYIRNTGLNNPLSLTQFGTSLNYAMKEKGKNYIRKRSNKGMSTNVEINTYTSQDWLPRAEEPS